MAVVIPALDEAGQVGAAIDSTGGPQLGIEIIVVDGGSRDATIQEARDAGARVLEGLVTRKEGRRARQLQLGFEASVGDPVLFLHADTRLARGWVEAVRGALEDPGVAGGAFRLRFDERGAAYRLLEGGVRLRVALFGLPYGDQAIFVRRGVLEAIGGVPDAVIMEDLDLVRAIKQHGRLARLPLAVTTSARRYRERGAVATVVRHLIAVIAWRLGVDRARVARFVHAARARDMNAKGARP